MTWQPVELEPPDYELIISGLLRSSLAAEGQGDVKVVVTMPATRPSRCVQVISDGGPLVGTIFQPRIRFLSWDTTTQKVNDLSRLVIALVPRMVGQAGITKTRHLSGPYEIPDAAPKRYALAEIHFRGDQL